jgi:hypothetical protein
MRIGARKREWAQIFFYWTGRCGVSPDVENHQRCWRMWVCVCVYVMPVESQGKRRRRPRRLRGRIRAQQEKFGAKLSGPTEHGGKWWWGLEDDKGSRERRRHSQREKRECETDQHSWSAGISTILGTTPISSLPWFFRLLAIRNLSSFPLSYCQLHILNSFTN